MNASYHHSQSGNMIIVTVGLTALAIIVAALFSGMYMPLLLLGGGLLVCLAIFGSLTVDVDAETVALRFGFGVVRRRFKVAEIRGVKEVRNSWINGWGIHRVERGWLFNVSGLDAVEIELVNGDAHRIGTDEPRELAAAIRLAAGLTRRAE
jgi:hypothetical protein